MWTIVLVVNDPLDRFTASGAISRCLSSIERLCGDYELVVVNNNGVAHVPALTEMLRGIRKPAVTIAEPNANLGTSGGFNLGLRSSNSKSDYVAFMSGDAEIIDCQMLQRLELTFERFSHVGVLHPISIYEDSTPYNLSRQFHSRHYFSKIRHHGAVDSEETIHQVSEALLRARSLTPIFSGRLPSFPLTFAAIKRSTIHSIGEFDEGVKGGCCENDDFAFRCLQSGLSVGRANNTCVYHHRYLFYRLTHPEGIADLPHAAVVNQAQEWWLQKWGVPYSELYFDWRWGKTVSLLAKPYFACRSVAGKLKREMLQAANSNMNDE